MSELRLGPLPKVRYVRRSVRLPEALDEELTEYATAYSRLYEPAEVADLIPHMLEDFLRSDRGWRARKAMLDRTAQRSARPPGTTRRSEPES